MCIFAREKYTPPDILSMTYRRRDIRKDGLGFFVFFSSMKWGIFDAGTKSTGERGSGRIYKNVAEFTKIASEGVLLLHG